VWKHLHHLSPTTNVATGRIGGRVRSNARGRTISLIDIYLEVGKKRAFAAALEWPGWCRVGKSEEEAIQALFDYAPRYARVARRLGFKAPGSVDDFEVAERLAGDASTDFGSLSGEAPAYDGEPVDEAEHQRLIEFLEACWGALDRAAAAARGKELSKGARGGGRDLDKILQHVLDGEGGYMRRLEYKRDKAAETDVKLSRAAMLEALASAVRGEVPEFGPRGGKRWSARYFVRREAWHVLDHTWEIEDRSD
jgi:hypothetical protein